MVYCGGHPWTGVHGTWLRGQGFTPGGIQLGFDADLEAMLLTLDRRNRLDQAIVEMAADCDYTAVVRRLGCLRGVSTLTAFGLAVEVGDWHRFTGPRSGPTSAWCPPSRPRANSAHRDRSPRPATPTRVGCWWRRPGTTAAPTAPPAP